MLEPKQLTGHLEELAGVCYCIAAASQGTSEEEMHVIADNLSLFSDHKVSRSEMAKLLSKARADVGVHGVFGYFKVLANRVSDVEVRNLLLGAAASVAFADRDASWDETKTFNELANIFGLSEQEAQFILHSVQRAIETEDAKPKPPPLPSQRKSGPTP